MQAQLTSCGVLYLQKITNHKQILKQLINKQTNITMAANNGNRFCQNCGGVWHQNHGRVCPVLLAQRQQRQPPAQQQAPQAPRANGGEEIQDLIRRVRLLESVRTMVQPSGAVVEDMRFPAPGQPRGSVNRVFTLYLGLLPSANTSGIVYVPMPRAVGVTSGSPEFLDVAPTMPGFSEWAQGYGEVSISAVAVTYTPTAAGMVGSSFVSIGVGRADRSVSDASTVNTMERTVSMGWSTAGQLRTVYTPGGAFDRHLLGGRQNRQSRPWARVYVVRSSTAFVVPSGPAVNYTQSLGMLRLSIQCACMREEV